MPGPSVYLETLIREFTRLPGIGPKSASRLAFHVLKMSDVQVSHLMGAMRAVKDNIRPCRVCGSISDADTCSICCDTGRDRKTVCVVEEQSDVLTIERTGEYRGLYHVLMGVISPLDGIGPGDLNIDSLVERCRTGEIGEVILATNLTVEGDATSLYLARLMKSEGIRVMRIAHGLPAGADLEFADSATIAQSIKGRVEI